MILSSNFSYAKKHTSVRPVTIAIDPGHGGRDYGAIGIKRRAEKTITLAISTDLYKLINLTPHLKAVLTRSNDRALGLKQRIDIARKNRARLLVSIHVDASKSAKAHGASVYILSTHGKRSAATIWLEKRENRGEFVSGLNLKTTKRKLATVLIDIAQSKTQQQSLSLAKAVLSALGAVNSLHKATVQKANFIVLKAPDIPSVLIETGFITNKEDAKKLILPSYQRRIASAILKGIINYLNSHPLPQIQMTKQQIPDNTHYVYPIKAT